ncbi:MAG: PocR ligand-binding domain-containing protein [Verrucomicrobia bacterium]|nr:PocR ligand-binding domain-containing protein [Verrucomicrobiota bacterium]
MKHPEMNFVFQKEARALLDSFTGLLGIRICFRSLEGRELLVGKRKGFCKFCKLIRHRMELEPRCLDCDRQNWKIAERTGKPLIYKCFAGMMDGCMPVSVEGRIIGCFMLGQFRTSERCSSTVSRKWKEQFGNDDLQKAFAEAPCFPAGKVKDILAMLTSLTEFIITRHLISLYGPTPLHPLFTYLAEHPDLMLSVDDAARLIRRSPSSLAHLFKAVAGKSFLQYQIEAKLDLADRMFAKQPNITVSETAGSLGFKDPYYFSRLYKKHRGHSPAKSLSIAAMAHGRASAD